MDDRIRRWGQGGICHQEASRTPSRSHFKKSPSGSWQHTVPAWEKEFCSLVGSVPWRKVLEAKKVMPFYENVLKWNDSAVNEAFNKAKNRFFAKINELLLDLEQEPLPCDDDKEGKSTLVGDSLIFLNQPVPCSVWGDAEEDPIKRVDYSSKPGLQVCVRTANNADNPWERKCAWGNNTLENSTWGDPSCNSWESNQWERNNNNWENPEPRKKASWGTWNENYRKIDDASQYKSRYKTSRFQRDYYLTDNEWKNGRGRKRVNLFYERPLEHKKPLASQQWNSIHYCRPISHRGSREAGNPWGGDFLEINDLNLPIHDCQLPFFLGSR
ncbi:uncharacterized protein LOC122088312 isoform X2 [Macadamia integrifolia]|uniref:uncharacterized protein LOC122088312 isoform X2 n=1 Tax=Macadamia integrifolia TaxID=60698 RepID=UPI001C4F4A43|nr:uncharacterized protein LOC122088312 isoform X2 [Macadamia integrifolia]